MLNIEISPDVQALVDTLRTVMAGEPITYDRLSASIGRDVRQSRYLLSSARRILVREGILFGTESGKGLARLRADQIAHIGHTTRKKIGRASRVAVKKMSIATRKTNNMSPEDMKKANAEISVLGVMIHLSADRAASPVEAHAKTPEPIAITAQRLLAGLRGAAEGGVAGAA